MLVLGLLRLLVRNSAIDGSDDALDRGELLVGEDDQADQIGGEFVFVLLFEQFEQVGEVESFGVPIKLILERTVLFCQAF